MYQVAEMPSNWSGALPDNYKPLLVHPSDVFMARDYGDCIGASKKRFLDAVCCHVQDGNHDLHGRYVAVTAQHLQRLTPRCCAGIAFSIGTKMPTKQIPSSAAANCASTAGA